MPKPSAEPRIPPLEPPYDPPIAAMLERWMSAAPEQEPLRLFRTLALHPDLAQRMGSLGGLLRDDRLIDPREREIVIHRTTARCGAEYEWGVHAVVFGGPLGLTDAQLAATARGAADDPVWSEREGLLVRLADELYEHDDVSDALWSRLAAIWSREELLELIVIAGWYRVISQMVNAVRIELEPWAARFPASDDSARKETP
jgi:4-carboxymuconolactone decarboxylase